MQKVRVAIVGSGNIGMNLLYKINKSKYLECAFFVGRNVNSANLKKAEQMGYAVINNSVEGLKDHEGEFQIVFDATSADTFMKNLDVYSKMKVFVIDMTPSRIGKLCIPCLNEKDCFRENNINMVTCGGQSVVPLAVALCEIQDDITYLEAISTIPSLSAGIGTRENIDEYIETTAMALKKFTGIQNTKAMIVLNPANPPIIMRNTLYASIKNPNLKKIKDAVIRMEKKIKRYVPGYKILVYPTLIDSETVTITLQVEGTGDYLPTFAGNLDIISCAGIEMAERYAGKK